MPSDLSRYLVAWECSRSPALCSPRACLLSLRAKCGEADLSAIASRFSRLLHDDSFSFCPEPPTQRPSSGPNNEKKDRAKQHRIVNSRLMRHCPETALDENGNFRRGNGDQHVDNEWDGGQAGEQSKEDECAADDFQHAHERGHQFWRRYPDLDEAPTPKSAGKRNFRIPSMLALSAVGN